MFLLKPFRNFILAANWDKTENKWELENLGDSDVGDIVMLVTLWWWPIWDVGGRIIMLTTFFRWWFFQFIKSVTIDSPTSWIGHQHLKFVTNIRHHHQCHRKFVLAAQLKFQAKVPINLKMVARLRKITWLWVINYDKSIIDIQKSTFLFVISLSKSILFMIIEFVGFISVWSHSGIHEPPGPRTDRSDLVLDFLIFFGPGPVRSEIFQILLVLVRFGPRFSKFC